MKRSSQLAAIVLLGCGSSTRPPAEPAPPTSAAPAATAASPAPMLPTEPAPPVAAKRAYAVKSPNGDRDDPYYWLRDDTRRRADVLAYLNAENDYANAILGPDK